MIRAPIRHPRTTIRCAMIHLGLYTTPRAPVASLLSPLHNSSCAACPVSAVCVCIAPFRIVPLAAPVATRALTERRLAVCVRRTTMRTLDRLRCSHLAPLAVSFSKSCVRRLIGLAVMCVCHYSRRRHASDFARVPATHFASAVYSVPTLSSHAHTHTHASFSACK